MPIVLENSIKEKLSVASVQKTASFINGAVGINPFEITETLGNVVGVIAGGVEAILELPTLVIKITSQIVTNVATYAAKKVGAAIGEIIMPPSPMDILGASAKKTKDYIQSVGDLLKELTSDSEQLNADDALAKQTEAINNKIAKYKEKIAKFKSKVDKIVGTVNEKCGNIANFIAAGPEWVEDQATIIEEMATNEIDKVVDESLGKIIKIKTDFINGLSDGLAKRTANVINKVQKKLLKNKLDKVAQAKQKIINKAKAKIGSALLNLMAKLGL